MCAAVRPRWAWRSYVGAASIRAKRPVRGGIAIKRVLAYGFPVFVLGVVAGLVGCSPGRQDSQPASLHVALVATFVSDGSVEGVATRLKSGVPDYNDDEKSFRVIGISAGDSAADPMSVMAGSARIAGMLASGEIELWISDAENAKRYADNGANFIALDELFAAEEIASFNGTPIAIPVTDVKVTRPVSRAISSASICQRTRTS